jgi:hypothetical protein
VELVNVSGSIWQKHGPRLPVGALSAPGFSRSPIAHISGSENSIVTSSSASDALKSNWHPLRRVGRFQPGLKKTDRTILLGSLEVASCEVFKYLRRRGQAELFVKMVLYGCTNRET